MSIITKADAFLGKRGHKKTLHGGHPMSMLLLPIKVLGWATVGVALGAGWKLGSYLVNAAMADENIKRFMRDFTCQAGSGAEGGEPLWARKFPKFSDD
jgi:hypothetical protein